MPNPPCGAVVSTMKTMMVPCIVSSARYISGVKSEDMNGIFTPGQARRIRISTERVMPRKTAKSARQKYWMPMTLWSWLKIYFQMKPSGALWTCAVVAPCVVICSLLGR